VLSAPSHYARVAHGGAVQRQAAAVAATLRDPRHTAIVLVATPEELAVNETIDLQRALADDLGMTIERVVVNRVLPAPFADAEAAALQAAPADPAIASALWLHRAASAQQRQLTRLRAAVGAVPLRTLALRFDGLDGADALRAIAESL
jgi:anion-transporting  ArsA/GET3 family ATPase